MALEQFDAEKARPLVQHVTRVSNDFTFANMFFVKSCSLRLRKISDNQRKTAPANESIHSESTCQPSASSHIDSVMSFETEELVHFPGGDPVSAYPLIRLTHTFTADQATKETVSRTNGLETLPESSKILGVLVDLAWLVYLLRHVYPPSARPEYWAKYQMTIQVEIYDLTSSERVRRGVKRAWLIGETLALETKYKGVRFRPDRSDTKPWTAEVKPPKEKNKVWIDDCNTPEAAARAYDVAAFYYGKGNEALNFEHTPRFLPKTLEDSGEQQKRRAIPKQAREQARHLRRNPLFYLIRQLPYELLYMHVVQGFLFVLTPEKYAELAFLVIELMRLVRKDDATPMFMLRELMSRMNVHVPTNIPQLLERIDCIIKKILPRGQEHYRFHLTWDLFNFFPRAPHLTAQYGTKDFFLTLIFIEWVRINLVTPQTTSMEAKHLPASPPQCNVPSITSVEIDLRAPQTSSMAMEAEDPLVNIPPQCNTLSMHYPHEQIQDTWEQDLIISHKFSLESQHSTYQDATPEEQVVKSSIVEQAATIVLSTPVAAIVETSLLPFPPLDVEIPNEGFQMGDLYEDIQEGSRSGQMTSTLGTLSNFHPLPFSLEQAGTILLSTPVAAIGETPLLPSPPPDVEIPNDSFQTGDLYEDIQEGSMSGEGTLSNFHRPPFSCFSPLSTGAQTQSSTFMDLDVGKDLMMPIPSSMEVGDCHPECNNLVVPLPLSHKYTQDALKQDLKNLAKLPLECEHLDFQVRSPEEDECIKSPTDQSATKFVDLDDGEALATLLERPQHDQLGDIGDWVASVETSPMEGYNPDMNNRVLTSVAGHIEGNEINSLLDQAATEIMDLDDGEDLTTLLERLQHDQLGDIQDRVASVEATLREGCNPGMNNRVLTSVAGHIEGNEINSLCEYDHVMKPPHGFAFSQQPFVQFDEYL